jgi:hypothetical protein
VEVGERRQRNQQEEARGSPTTEGLGRAGHSVAQ